MARPLLSTLQKKNAAKIWPTAHFRKTTNQQSESQV